MPKYAVTLMTVASTVVNVEADTEDEAIDKAFDNAPSAAWDWPDMGDWQLPSDMFPHNKAEDDVELIEE